MDTWIDFNLFGHQLVTHLNPKLGKSGKISNISNPVDEPAVPVPHFGVVMNFQDWDTFSEKVKGFIDDFVIGHLCAIQRRGRRTKDNVFFRSIGKCIRV
jgi:extradiol dioxygenase family protein